MGRSEAVSARYPNSCSTCGAKPYEPCRSLRTKRVTDAHQPRISAQFEREQR